MKCPRCESTKLSKNGRKRGKQRYLCKECGRQAVEFYSSRGYSDKVKQNCLTLYANGMGFRAIERSTDATPAMNRLVTDMKAPLK